MVVLRYSTVLCHFHCKSSKATVMWQKGLSQKLTIDGNDFFFDKYVKLDK